MRIFVAGGTGYIGRHVTEYLIKDGYEVRLLVRTPTEEKPDNKHVEIVYGNISDPTSLKGILDGCDAVVYLIGIIREFPAKGITFELAHVEGVRHIYEKAEQAGIKRWVHISANGVRADTPDGYIRTKYRAEEYIKAQNINYTILRPSIVFGKESGNTINFVNATRDLLGKLPLIVPVIGDGKYKFQPVHVDDIGRAISMIIDRPSTFNRIYGLCGTKSISYNEMIDIIANRYKLKKKIKLHIPAVFFKLAAKAFQHLETFPITVEQIDMLISGNTCSESDLFEELGITAKGFYESEQ